MKKAFDQTVRDLKREVNKKVLKVPPIEQKVLDATSNEPWGPHGALLADIAQATRNYHEYQMIMSIIWKRINDTGKNWRHVYKALTVLDYLVAHGSERVIDEIREHAYQIQTLSDFQYIDSSGRDQGNNVRKKSQSLVLLVNDKERIQEVRQKAAANRDKFRNTSTGNMYRPGSYSSSGSYGDRYDYEDRNGYGREKEYDYRDDDRYGRYGDPYGREGDRYGREYEDRYSRDDEYRGRSRSVDEYHYGSRSRSSDRDRDRSYEDDGQYSSSSAGRRLDRKYSEQNLGAPPSYEEALDAARSPTNGESVVRDGETSSASAPKPSSPPASASPIQGTSTAAPPPTQASPPAHASPPAPVTDNSEIDGFDEFDPRGAFSAAPATSGAAATTSSSAEMDLLGSLALVPVTSVTADSETETSINFASGATYVATTSASSIPNQTFEDPFGDGPFRASPSTGDLSGQQQSPSESFQSASNQGPELPQQVFQKPETELSTSDPNIDILADILPPTGPQHLGNSQGGVPAPANQPVPVPQQGFLPPTGQHSAQTAFTSQSVPTVPQTGFPAQPALPAPMTGFPAQSQPSIQAGFPAHSGQSVPQASFQSLSSQAPSLPGFATQAGQAQTTSQIVQPSSISGFPSQTGPFSQPGFQILPGSQSAQPNAAAYGVYNVQPTSASPVGQHMAPQVFTGSAAQQNATNSLSRSGSGVPVVSQMAPPAPQLGSSALMASQSTIPASTGSLASAPQPTKDKFETKSTVWADTLSRGLVNLNISGSKTNPLSDIGVDFEALNRKEKRMEKPAATSAVSTVTMGKAMGSGSGIGRAGAGAFRPPSNLMMGTGMGMGIAGAPRPGIGMGGYAGMNQPMGVGMGMNMQANMGMGMNTSIGGMMQQPTGFGPGSIARGYNPSMGAGNYGQQPYSGGYRSS